MTIQILLEPELMIRRRPSHTLNRLPRLSDWSVGDALPDVLRNLNQPVVIHRKAWEYGLCITGLATLGVVTPEARALAVGAGYESPLFYFANHIAEMVATDLYDNPSHEGQPAMVTSPDKFAPFEYRHDHLKVFRMSGDNLEFDDDTFDFVFCLSSIEHFGSRATQRKALSEMRRVLRPGGIACIITELILNGGVHDEYFTPAEMEQMFLRDRSFPLVGGPFSGRISQELCAMPVDVRDADDLRASPHIVLTDGNLLWTSASLFLQKQ
ncbi:MAG TPA: methyltransferase domain-containing protein [Nitrospiraceae bacterium]|nr:methyltransferase domain-containing protein [Nitrospiraceae bacterium]